MNIDLDLINYIFLTSLEDCIALVFLIKLKKFNGKVYTTSPISQIGVHVVKEFYNLVKNRNRYISEDELN